VLLQGEKLSSIGPAEYYSITGEFFNHPQDILIDEVWFYKAMALSKKRSKLGCEIGLPKNVNVKVDCRAMLSNDPLRENLGRRWRNGEVLHRLSGFLEHNVKKEEHPNGCASFIPQDENFS
jgi:hypothetical protein